MSEQQKKDGGPVVAARATGHVRPPNGSADTNLTLSFTGGLSLRDYFAGQALIGLLMTGKEWWTFNGDASQKHGVDVMAYLIADAMLAAREK